MATGRVDLKLLVDKSNRTVLFAEGGKDFVDLLFHILTLPVGMVTSLLGKTGMVGSLGNLYGSVEKLNGVYIKSDKKDILLKPKAPAFVSELPSLLPATASSESTPKSNYRPFISGNSGRWTRPISDRRGRSMNQICTLGESPAGNRSAAVTSAAEWDGKDGFVQGVVTYMVMDNLEVKPMSTISCITLLNKSNVKHIGHLEEKVVSLGLDEGIKLLRASLHSKKVLTDVFLGTNLGRSSSKWAYYDNIFRYPRNVESVRRDMF